MLEDLLGLLKEFREFRIVSGRLMAHAKKASHISTKLFCSSFSENVFPARAKTREKHSRVCADARAIKIVSFLS